jgi:hypothetical protein
MVVPFPIGGPTDTLARTLAGIQVPPDVHSIADEVIE